MVQFFGGPSNTADLYDYVNKLPNDWLVHGVHDAELKELNLELL